MFVQLKSGHGSHLWWSLEPEVLKTLLGTCLTTVWFIPVPARRGLLEGGLPKLCVLYLDSSKIRVSGLTLAPANSDAMFCSELNLSSQQKTHSKNTSK